MQIFQYNFPKRKSLVIEEDDNIANQNNKRSDHTDAFKIIGNINNTTTSNSTNNKQNVSAKKHFDHSNYWKIVAQDFAKKLDDSAREKDLHKEQATG